MSPKFNYVPRTVDQIKKRAEQKAGKFDRIYKDDIKVFAPKAGDHRFRILPPTWENPAHYGLEVWIHSNIGADSQSYLCREKMLNEKCPICDEMKRLKATNGSGQEFDEAMRALRAYKRVLVWAIDRNEPSVGPCLYPMPWTMDRDLCSMSIDKTSGEMLQIDHPTEGFDVEFAKEGSGIKTQYTGIMISRRPSPISTDKREVEEWLTYISANPVPETLVYHEYAYIQNIHDGGASAVEAPAPRVTTRQTTVASDDDDDVTVEVEDRLSPTEPEVEPDAHKEAFGSSSMNRRERLRDGIAKATGKQ